MSEEKISLTFAYPYQDAAGKNHNADATASLPREEAIELIHYGRARAVDPTPAASTATAPKEVK